MARFKPLTVLLVASAAFAAVPAEARPRWADPNRTLYSVNQPVVQRTDYVMDLASSGTGLPVSEMVRLEAWFDSLGLGYGDRVWVEEPYGYTGTREDVARVAADYGILVSAGSPVTAGQVAPGSVRVVISRMTASVPNCPNDIRGGGASSTSPNYGCAVNSNFAAMVANPEDLVLGQQGSRSSDAATAAKAIKVYRDAVPTGTKGLETVTSRGK